MVHCKSKGVVVTPNLGIKVLRAYDTQLGVMATTATLKNGVTITP